MTDTMAEQVVRTRSASPSNGHGQGVNGSQGRPSGHKHDGDDGDDVTCTGSRERRSPSRRSRSRGSDGSRDRHRRRRRSDSDSPERRRRRRHRDEYEYGSRSHRRDDRYDDQGDRRYHRRHREERNRIKNISVEDELAQLDRTMRTVQVYNLNLKASERDLFQFFVQAGPLVDIKIIKDRMSGRSKGFAYVEFEKRESVTAALGLSGQELMGQAVMVKPSEAEKNVAWHTAQAAKKQALEGNGTSSTAGKVKLSNVHPSLSEEFLKPIFEPFGPVFSVHVDRDGSGESLGSAIVQFVNSKDAQQAVAELEGKIDIQGMLMRLEMHSSSVDAVAQGMVEERIDVDADDGGGMKLSAQSRANLMNRLAANAGIEVPKMPDFAKSVASPVETDETELMQGVLGPASPIPTPCVLLKNAFDPAQETEPCWNEDIQSDIRDECSKFGRVLFLHLDKDSKGCVYIKFDNVQAAVAAQKTLHGRWYNQRKLYADFQFVQLFDKHFHV